MHSNPSNLDNDIYLNIIMYLSNYQNDIFNYPLQKQYSQTYVYIHHPKVEIAALPDDGDRVPYGVGEYTYASVYDERMGYEAYDEMPGEHLGDGVGSPTAGA